MQHASANPSSVPSAPAHLRFQARFIMRPQLLTRISPLPTGRDSPSSALMLFQ